MNKEGDIIKIWDSLISTLGFFGKASNSNIGQACRKKSIAYGFRWKYYEE